MCKTAHFRSRSCGHHWLQIAQPCGPGRGFSTCATFRGDGVAREPAAECRVGAPCPACSSCYYSATGGGMYDRNSVRMVTDMRRRWRWGLGPSKRDPGVECVVM
ncbi:hypothetical protein F4775DRAFT_593712 [Biscogniauxia sp. FL1348]|nr:hypothetical protein F4775DRAFT_593712 [Biscogniauxia sp. FL1348]